MKFSFLVLSLTSVLAFSIVTKAEQKTCETFKGEVNFTCVADAMQAINSSIYYNLSDAEINEMLADCSHYGHVLAVQIAQACEKK